MAQPANQTPPDLPRPRTATRAPVWLVAALFLVALGAAMKAMAAVAVPIVFAILITLFLAPLHRRLIRLLPKGLKWLSYVGVMTVLLGVIAVFAGGLVFAAERVLAAIPDISDTVDSVMAQTRADPTETAWPAEQLRALWKEVSGMLGGWIVDQATGLARAIVGMTGAFLTALVLVFFIVLLAMTELTQWRNKIDALASNRQGQHAWRDIVATLTQRLRRFLLVRTAVGILQAGLYTGWLALFGVDLLVVWAVLTFFLTYIPNLGSLISGTLPVLYALITKDPATALALATGIFLIEQAIGNFIDPRLLGRQIVLSPLIILVSLIFWGWLWGAAGAFLATPIMLSVLVTCNHIPALRPVALMISNQPSPEALDKALAG